MTPPTHEEELAVVTALCRGLRGESLHKARILMLYKNLVDKLYYEPKVSQNIWSLIVEGKIIPFYDDKEDDFRFRLKDEEDNKPVPVIFDND